MMAAEPYFKTQRVAKALGVSASTIKRWVDSGTIKAVRTAGKHRLIPMSEALRVARDQGVDATNVEVTRWSREARLPQIDRPEPGSALQPLVESKVRQAKVLIQAVYSAGCGAAMLGDDLIRPVMERIGHGWMVGALDVYQEHEASQIVASAIQELIERAATAPTRCQPDCARCCSPRVIRMFFRHYSASSSCAKWAGKCETSASICRSARWPKRRSLASQIGLHIREFRQRTMTLS